jgi:HAD superfamily hydrolase (TIGR01509 family)
MARFDLVIFDCDGVVVDSERIVHDVFGEFIGSFGLRLDDEELHERFLGLRLSECVAAVEQLSGMTVPPDAVARYCAERDRVLREQVRAVDGVREVLEALGSLRLPFCLASSGGHDKMRVSLGATGLWPLFEGRIYSATEVPRGKPAPDVFLLAAERMGARPAGSVVIEDSVNGVLAGRAAGMTVLGFKGLTPAEKLAAAGAERVLGELRELLPLLA